MLNRSNKVDTQVKRMQRENKIGDTINNLNMLIQYNDRYENKILDNKYYKISARQIYLFPTICFVLQKKKKTIIAFNRKLIARSI